jgi:hypothetical protein
MRDRTTHRITFLIAASGVILAVVTTVLAGFAAGLGAVVGATVAVANWLVLRWVVRRVVRASNGQRAGLMILLVGKMGALVALCWILIARAGVDPIGFVVGSSALFVGIVLGASLGEAAPGSRARDDLVEEEG